MRPIPKRVLIHSATLMHETAPDIWGNSGTTDTDLTFIRIDPSDKLVNTSENQERILESLMLYDFKNSRPLNQTFEKNDKLLFDGKTYTIISIEKCHDRNSLHHLEIGLV